MPIVAQRRQSLAVRGEPDFPSCGRQAAQNMNATVRLQLPKNDQSTSRSWLSTADETPPFGVEDHEPRLTAARRGEPEEQFPPCHIPKPGFALTSRGQRQSVRMKGECTYKPRRATAESPRHATLQVPDYNLPCLIAGRQHPGIRRLLLVVRNDP